MKDKADKDYNDIVKRGATYDIRQGVYIVLMRKWPL